MKKKNILWASSELSWTSGTFDSETKTVITESQEAIEDFINQQKIKVQTQKKWENWKLTCVRAWPLFMTFCQNLFERTEEKRRRIRASDSSQFSAQFKLTAILIRKIDLTYPWTMSSKNSEKSLQQSESH